MKNNKKLLAVLLILGIIIIFSQASTFADVLPGDTSWYTGSESSYLLEDSDDLFGLAALVNSGTDDFSSVTITLNSNISITDYVYESVTYPWTPIGTSSHPFKGNFEGGDNTIGLSGGGSDYQGLFGYIDNAAVSNLTVSGSVYGDDYVGGVVGYAAGSTLNNITANVDVDGDGDYAGGIVGFAEDTDLEQVRATGGSVEGGSYAGGIAGRMTGSSSLTDSYATAPVDAEDDYAGGLAGSVEGDSSLIHSFYYNSGGATSGGPHAGGTAGDGSPGSSYYLDTAEPDTAGGAARNADSFKYGEVLYLLTKDNPDLLWEQDEDYPVWGSGERLYRVGIDGARTAADTVDIAGSNVFNAGEAQQWVYVPDDTTVTLDVTCDADYHVEFNPPSAVTEVTPGSEYTVTVDGADIDLEYGFYSTVPPDLSWYDAEAGTLTIADEADLRALAYIVNAGTDDFTGVTIELDTDITLSGGSWTPIGDDTHNFNGTFDGRDKKISGITVNSGAYSALFGYTGSGALIKDLKVNGAEINAGQYLAAVVAYNKGALENVTNEGVVNAVASGGVIYVGGVVGYSESALNGLANNGEITASLNGTESYVGGVAGFVTAAVADCSNTADVTTNAGYTGGVIGYLSPGTAGTPNTLESCINTGAVTNTGKSGARIGGVAGSAGYTSGGSYVTFRHSYNLGNVTYTSDSLEPSGVAGVAASTGMAAFTDVFNKGEVSSAHSANVVGAVCSSSGAAISHAYYLQNSIKRGGSTATPADSSKVTAVPADAFSNGEVAYRLKASTGLWTMDPLVPNHPVFSDSADNNVYQVALADAVGGDITVDTLISEDYAPDTSAYEKAGGTFTLTNTPDAGNILKLLEGRDSSGDLLYSYNQHTLPTGTPASFTMPAGDLTVTAQFAATPVTSHIVAFNNNASLVGGTDTTVTQSVYQMDTAVEPPDPTLSLDGGITYDFAGWYSDPELTSPYNFHSIVTDDITLYAKWEIGDFAAGTPGAPKIIDNMAGLIALANAVAAGHDFSGGYFKLNSDVTLPSGWKGIGSESNPFNGTFDGDDNTITFDFVTTAGHPLFNYLGEDAVVEKLNMSATATSNMIGGVRTLLSSIAKTNNGTIRDCNVVWTSISDISANPNGGIVSTNNGLINNCEVKIKIDNLTPQAYFGGIAGSNTGTISDCRLSPASEINANYFAGICYTNTGIVTRCTIGSPDQDMLMTGAMALTSIANTNTGGTISYCKNYANINETMMMGALVMSVTGGTITHNENHGDVNVQNGNAAGIVWQVSGSNPVELTYNVNYGNITGAISPTGSMALGGIVAILGGDPNAIVSYNSNHGDIKGGGGANFGVGGIIGTLSNGNNTRTISYNYNTGDIEGIRGSAAGGIIGVSNGNETLNNCYSTGNVKSNAEAGALVGKTTSINVKVNVNNSYWFGGSIEGGTASSFVGGTGAITNSYYGSPNDDFDFGDVTGLERMLASRFMSGEVAYLLDGGAGEHLGRWSLVDGLPVILPDSSYYPVQLLPASNGTITFGDGSTFGYFAEGSTVGIMATPADPPDDDALGSYQLIRMTVNHLRLGSSQDISGSFTMQASEATVSGVFSWVEEPLPPVPPVIDEDDDDEDDKPDEVDETPGTPEPPSGGGGSQTGTDDTGVPDDDPGFGVGSSGIGLGTEGSGGLVNVIGSPTGSPEIAPERETPETAAETNPEASSETTSEEAAGDVDDEQTGPAEIASEGTTADPAEPVSVPEGSRIYKILQTARQVIVDNPVASGAVAGCLLLIVALGGISRYRNIKK